MPTTESQIFLLNNVKRMILERHYLIRTQSNGKRLPRSIPPSLIDACKPFQLSFDGDHLPLLPKPQLDAFLFGTLQVEFYLDLIYRMATQSPLLDPDLDLACEQCHRSCAETPYLLTIDGSADPHGSVCHCDIDHTASADHPIHMDETRWTSYPTNVSAVGAGFKRHGSAVCLGCLWTHYMMPTAASTPVLNSIFGLREKVLQAESQIDGNVEDLCRLISTPEGSMCAFRFSLVSNKLDTVDRSNIRTVIELMSDYTMATGDADVDIVSRTAKNVKDALRGDCSPEISQARNTIDVMLDRIVASIQSRGDQQSASPPPQQPQQQQHQSIHVVPTSGIEPGWIDAIRRHLGIVRDYVTHRGDLVVTLNGSNVPSQIAICSFCHQLGHTSSRMCPFMHRAFEPAKKMEPNAYENHLKRLIDNFKPHKGSHTKATLEFVEAMDAFFAGFAAAVEANASLDNDDAAEPRNMDYMCGNPDHFLLDTQISVPARDSAGTQELQPYAALRSRNHYQQSRQTPVHATVWVTAPEIYVSQVLARRLQPSNYLDMASFTNASEVNTVIQMLAELKYRTSHIDTLYAFFSSEQVTMDTTGDPPRHSPFYIFERIDATIVRFIECTLPENVANVATKLHALSGSEKSSSSTNPKKKRKRKDTGAPTHSSTESRQLTIYTEEVGITQSSVYVTRLVEARAELFDNLMRRLYLCEDQITTRGLSIPEISEDSIATAITSIRQHRQHLAEITGTGTAFSSFPPALNNGPSAYYPSPSPSPSSLPSFNHHHTNNNNMMMDVPPGFADHDDNDMVFGSLM